MFKEYASGYFDSNLNVIPLNGKKPIQKEWSQWCTKQINDRDIDLWLMIYSKSNIGLPLGPINKMIAIDIDTDDPEVLKSVPLSPCVKRGKKGETRFFKYNGEQPRKRHDLFIELLSTGNQTVVPPSVHPETQLPYIWLTKDTLENFDIDQLPDLDKKFIEYLDVEVADSDVTQSDGTRCNHGSHMKLSKMLKAKLDEGTLPEQIVKELLLYDEKINPNMSYFTCPSRKEWKRSKNKELNAYFFTLQAFKNHKKDIDFDEIIIDLGESVKEAKELPKRIMLPHLRGMGKEIFDHLYKTSYVKRSRFAFAGALSSMSVLMGNKFHFQNTYSNTYCLIIGPSGSGKDRPLEFISQYLYEAEMQDLIGIGTPQSPQAVISNLPIQRQRIDLIDESNGFFEKIMKVGHHQSGIDNILAELYTRPGKFYSGMSAMKYKEPLGRCFSPCVSILTAMTIKGFRSSFTTNLIDEGLGGRFLYFIDERYKQAENFVENQATPKNLIEFANECQIKRTISTEIDTESKPTVVEIDFKNRWAKEHYIEICKEIEKLKSSSFKDDRKTLAIANRSIEIIKRMALMDCVSTQIMDDGFNMAITKDNLDWAFKFNQAHVDMVDKFFTENLHDSLHSDIQEAIISIIENHESDTIPKTDLTQTLRNRFKGNIDKKMWDNELSTLLDSGFIEKCIVKKSQKSTNCYRLKKVQKK